MVYFKIVYQICYKVTVFYNNLHTHSFLSEGIQRNTLYKGCGGKKVAIGQKL